MRLLKKLSRIFRGPNVKRNIYSYFFLFLSRGLLHIQHSPKSVRAALITAANQSQAAAALPGQHVPRAAAAAASAVHLHKASISRPTHYHVLYSLQPSRSIMANELQQHCPQQGSEAGGGTTHWRGRRTTHTRFKRGSPSKPPILF